MIISAQEQAGMTWFVEWYVKWKYMENELLVSFLFILVKIEILSDIKV